MKMKTFQQYIGELKVGDNVFGGIKSFSKDDQGHDDAVVRLEKLSNRTCDDALFLIYNWIQRNEIGPETFKFLLVELEKQK